MKLKFNFRLKIIIGFISIAIISVVLLQIVTKEYVRGILLKELFENFNYFPEIISITNEAIEWNNDLLIANKIMQLTQLDDVETIMLIENERIFISNLSDSIGETFTIDNSDFIRIDNNYINYYDNKMYLMTDFTYEGGGEQPIKRYFDILMILDTAKMYDAINELNRKFILLGLGIVFYGITLAIPFGGFFSKRILKISEAARRIGKGDLTNKLEVKKKLFNDEIDELANEINLMVDNLKTAEELKLEKEIIKQELNIATQIQQMLLPKKNPDYPFLETGSFYRAAKEVGGDYFDWIIIDDDNLGILMADVSGKGVPGSLVMTMTRNIIRSKASTILEPDVVLKEVNETLLPDLKRGMFVTVWYGVLNFKTFNLTFTNAGHTPLLVYNAKNKCIDKYKLKGMPLGIAKPNRFNKFVEKREITLDKNDIILQYTDGITEAYDINENLFGDQRLEDVFFENSNKSFNDIINEIISAIEDHADGAEQSDDIAIIGLKVKEKSVNKNDSTFISKTEILKNKDVIKTEFTDNDVSANKIAKKPETDVGNNDVKKTVSADNKVSANKSAKKPETDVGNNDVNKTVSADNKVSANKSAKKPETDVSNNDVNKTVSAHNNVSANKNVKKNKIVDKNENLRFNKNNKNIDSV